jgi:hypothetical protein
MPRFPRQIATVAKQSEHPPDLVAGFQVVAKIPFAFDHLNSDKRPDTTTLRAGQKPGGKAEALALLKIKGLSRFATRRPLHIAIRALGDTPYCVMVVNFG